MGLARSDAGISRVVLPRKSPDDVLTIIDATNARLDKNAFADLTQRLLRYFDSKQVDFPDKIDLSHSTAFKKLVWQAAQTIPYGQTRSYAWIAKRIGNPSAARAVGQALRENTCPILIPCHRVISISGALGGFSSGPQMKQLLLNMERNEE